LVLKAGAVYELKTKTGLRFDSSGKPVPGALVFGPKKADETLITTINSKPAQVRITCRLHTANGAIHNRQSTKRLWPARGDWSGLLTTASTRVELKSKQ
jgi:hypothetical protein